MPDEPPQPLYDRLERLEHELERLTAAVGLLGIKPCSWCKKFLRSSDPATFFSRDTPVCYECVPEWWHYQCNQLSVNEREIIERQLKIWLLRYRHIGPLGYLRVTILSERWPKKRKATIHYTYVAHPTPPHCLTLPYPFNRLKDSEQLQVPHYG